MYTSFFLFIVFLTHFQRQLAALSLNITLSLAGRVILMKKCAICEKPLEPDEVVFCKSCEVFYEYELEHDRKREGLEKLKEDSMEKGDDE